MDTRRTFGAASVAALSLAAVLVGPDWSPSEKQMSAAVIVNLDRPLNRFTPALALGAGVDGHDQGDVARIFTAPNIRAMRSAGLRAFSYRLRTELAVEAWHWNPRGTWSDGRHRRGYWTSSSRPAPGPAKTNGYLLPRRGNTIDQADNHGYSRLDDGDPRSFWKSNPYLDSHYTREPESLHPQWVMIDLGRERPVDVVRLAWAAPYARRLRVEHWTGSDAGYGAPDGAWQAFPHANFRGRGGRQSLRLADSPVAARFVRVLMTASSHTALSRSTDIRDRLGFAVGEVDVGASTGKVFKDEVRHAASRRQSLIYVSSTDPWHRATDLDPHLEQPSFARVASSGLTHGQPIMAAVPVLYGTPADAAAELRYLRSLRIPVDRLELGEEPDGQLVTPEDYGALYVQFARALHRVDARIRLGGPGYQTSLPTWYAWPAAHGNRSWTNRFIAELRRNRALRELGFFSFEWYPFDLGCNPAGPQLASAYALLRDSLRRQRAEGLPRRVPLVISEYGYSAFAAQQMVDLPGAILNADIVGEFLSLGGNTAYLYGYEPDVLIKELDECNSWGNLILFRSDSARRIRQPVATYWAARLLTRHWTEPGYGKHIVLEASSSARDEAGNPLVTAYAVRRPDRRVAVLLINKDPRRAWRIRLDLLARGSKIRPPSIIDVRQFSPKQYVWHARGERGYAKPDSPPAHELVHTSGETILALPASSITVALTATRP